MKQKKQGSSIKWKKKVHFQNQIIDHNQMKDEENH